MKKDIQKRIAIIGQPGSGKSTFEIELGKVLNVPVHHLDWHMFEPNGKKKDRQELLAIEQVMVNEELWIVEGCSISTLRIRFARANAVIYFQFPRFICIFKRLFYYDKVLTKTGCTRKMNWRLLKYIWTFDKEKGPIIEEVRKKYPHIDFFNLKCSKEADEYMGKLLRNSNEIF